MTTWQLDEEWERQGSFEDRIGDGLLMIGVISYGMANIGSMINMLERIGADVCAITTPDDLSRASRIILPGVGAFDHGMAYLRRGGWIDAVTASVREGTPLLGVCLGMQLLADGSEEGSSPGLGLVSGYCRKLSTHGTSLKIPHMGWKTLKVERPTALLQGLDTQSRFYFVHSYHFDCADPRHALASACYGAPFTAVIGHDNVWGTQFHPEKSHRFGMALLKNFAVV